MFACGLMYTAPLDPLLHVIPHDDININVNSIKIQYHNIEYIGAHEFSRLLIRADVRIRTKDKTPLSTTRDENATLKPTEPSKTLKQTNIESLLNRGGPNIIIPSTSTESNKNSKGTFLEVKSVSIPIQKACTNFKCKFCSFLDTSGHTQCSLTKETFETKFNVNGQYSNLIYGIDCNKYGQHCVGQTKGKLYQRLQQDLGSIKLTLDVRDNPDSK
jgi:hypothetical protein